MLQRKKLLAFADWLARRRNAEFNMLLHDFCIAGWAVKWWDNTPKKDHDGYKGLDEFGLGHEVTMNLYLGSGSKKDWAKINRMDAVRALRNAANRRKKIWEC